MNPQTQALRTRRTGSGAGRASGILLFTALAVPLSSQAQAPVGLGPPLAVHPESFALVTTVRELSDRRLMVADPIGRSLVVLSADLRSATPLGRIGEGPDEFGQPDGVWALPGDSTLLVDLGNARLTVIAPNGRFARTIPIVPGGFEPGRPPVTILPGGVDARGHIYYRGSPMAVGGQPADSTDILRFDPITQQSTRVARVKLPQMRTQTSGGPNNSEVRTSQVPLSASDAWGVAPDGRVALIRNDPYRVDWAGDSGTRAGPAVAYTPVRIRAAEREEWDEERGRSGGVGVQVEITNGQPSISFQRTTGRGGSDLANLAWPDAKPPFVEGSVRVDREGRVWVRRSLPAGEAALYDVFDGSGRLVSSVRFPANRRLVGFGSGTLYAAHIDAFDLVVLERYRLPG